MTNTPQSIDPGRAFRKKVTFCLLAVVVLALLGCAWVGIQDKLNTLGNQPTSTPTIVQQVIVSPSTVTVAPTTRKREVEQAKVVTVPESVNSVPAAATSLPATTSVAPTTEATVPPSSKAPMAPTTEETSAPTEPSTSSPMETPSQG